MVERIVAEFVPRASSRAFPRIRRHPLWDQIEIRLRHRWPPYRVARWLKEEHPDLPPLSHTILRAYAKAQPLEWFVQGLVVVGKLRREAERIVVVERHAQLIHRLENRLVRLLKLEDAQLQHPNPDKRIPFPEIIRAFD